VPLSGAAAPVDITRLSYLVVADNRYARSFIKGALQPYGLSHIHDSADVGKAIKFLSEVEIHLAIIDMEMNLLSGIDFTRLVRRGGEVRNDELPIVIASANAETTTVAAAANAGANAYVIKPFSGDTLYRRIRAILTNPVPFIRCDSYVGPDRRWRGDQPPGGVDRRQA
jgi:DNA-binding response OmpR family regulator